MTGHKNTRNFDCKNHFDAFYHRSARGANQRQGYVLVSAYQGTFKIGAFNGQVSRTSSDIHQFNFDRRSLHGIAMISHNKKFKT